jgi:hypothetical protein
MVKGVDTCQITSFQRFQYSNRLCHQRIAISKRACAYNCNEQKLRGAVTPVTSASRTALASSGRIHSHALFTGSGRKIRSSRPWVLDTINSATLYNGGGIIVRYFVASGGITLQPA